MYYRKEINNHFAVSENRPLTRAFSFAFDTETLTLFDGKVISESELRTAVEGLTIAEVRKRISVKVWAWQIYDEYNGFYMTDDFEMMLTECCRRGYGIGWCYNATFDFAQIDWQVLSNPKWKLLERGTGKAYSKGQSYAYSSIHNDMGARYSYKLWMPYRNPRTRHKMVHPVEFRDFMKFVPGGLRKLLEDFEIMDEDGITPLRKLTMDYQAVEPSVKGLTDEEIAYCRNDVAGLYFAVKKFNGSIEAQSAGECHIFGENTNLMTAGGFAKRSLLQSLYPEKPTYKSRLRAYQKEHPLTMEQDKWLRANHLYRGGIAYLNPAYKGKLITDRPMYRYDVNSEYPYSMAQIRDLVGKPIKISLAKWQAMPAEEKENYECAYMLTSVSGTLKKNMLGVWYDPFQKEFVDDIEESGRHMMFERELDEMQNWYDLEIECDTCIVWKRGTRAYRDFVESRYQLKALAKEKTTRTSVKLELNSSYGKLAERQERQRCHYVLDHEANAVRCVKDEIELDGKGSMNLAVGALITSFARCYILSKIREICPNPKRDFVYIDTDSIHTFNQYDNADPKELGALKCEACCPAIKYIAPKTYLDVLGINEDGTIGWRDFEIHSKGVSIGSILADLQKKQKGKKNGLPTLELLASKMEYGAKYPVLMAMNVQGGKALVPVYKYLAKPLGDDVAISNMAGTMLVEA